MWGDVTKLTGQPGSEASGSGRKFTFRAMLLLLLLAVVMPSICVELVAHYHWIESNKEAEKQSCLEMSRSVASAFNTYVQQLDQHQRTIADTMELMPSPSTDTLNDLLKIQAANYPAVQRFVLIGGDKKVIASSRPAGVG